VAGRAAVGGHGHELYDHINLGGQLSPIDADGAAIIIHQNADTNQTGTKGQGVGGGTPIAAGLSSSKRLQG
jgi:Cu/Zn superoxide dismutase